MKSLNELVLVERNIQGRDESQGGHGLPWKKGVGGSFFRRDGIGGGWEGRQHNGGEGVQRVLGSGQRGIRERQKKGATNSGSALGVRDKGGHRGGPTKWEDKKWKKHRGYCKKGGKGK